MGLYKRDDCEFWHCDFYVEGRKGKRVQRCTGFRSKRRAEQRAEELRAEALQAARDPRHAARSRATVADALELLTDYCDRAVNAGDLAPDTVVSYRVKAGHLRRVLGPTTPLVEITTARVREYCTTRREESDVCNHTLTKELAVLVLMMRLAAEADLWQGDARALRPAGISARYKPRETFLKPAQVWRLKEHLAARRWASVAFAVGSGAEFGTWARAERMDLRLKARPPLVRVRGSKTATRDREVPVVLDVCKKLLGEALRCGDGRGGKLLAPWPNVIRDLRLACEAAKVPRVTPNDLRRTFAHWHVEAGYPLDTIAHALGHASLTMLMKVYGKPTGAELARRMARSQEKPEKKPRKRSPRKRRS